MVLGLLLIAIISGAVAALWLFLISAPLWVVLAAYPATGTVVMLVGTGIIGLYHKAKAGTKSLPDHLPVQRNTTPTVATSTLTSVVKDKVRS